MNKLHSVFLIVLWLLSVAVARAEVQTVIDAVSIEARVSGATASTTINLSMYQEGYQSYNHNEPGGQVDWSKTGTGSFAVDPEELRLKTGKTYTLEVDGNFSSGTPKFDIKVVAGGGLIVHMSEADSSDQL
ncbi:hypothetical protein MLD52_23155, partial [Puniceicoccaceae bacterium K14]|nr:hypothetical protein [Puniceicoccaceae bacterium K14]